MIVLASTSPTRQAMLKNAGLHFISAAPFVDERSLVSHHPEWAPRDVAAKLAEAKAVEVSMRHPQACVIGADQVLALSDKVFSKPKDTQECRDHLLELRGKTHLLISSVVIARNGEAIWAHVGDAKLTMRNFTDDFLTLYLERIGSDCTSSVGGYKIEGLGLQLFERVEGDHFTILGLPLLALLEQLRRMGEVPA